MLQSGIVEHGMGEQALRLAFSSSRLFNRFICETFIPPNFAFHS
jgi:hypothetical protein